MMRELLRFLSDDEGGAMIEAAVFIPLLLVAYLGVIELTQYINAKDRVNRLLNQTTDLFITSSTAAEVTEAWNATLAIRTVVAAPNDVAIGLRYCSATSGPGTAYDVLTVTPTYGQCGVLDTGTSGITIPTLTCPANAAAYRPGFTEMIRMRAACRYKPLINWLNLFPDGIAIDTGVVEVPIPRSS